MKSNFDLKILIFFVFSILLISCHKENANEKVTLFIDNNNPMMEFIVEEIKSTLSKKDIVLSIAKEGEAYINMSINAGNEKLKPEGFVITKDENNINVIGFDAAGVMYGGLELAEQIRLFGLKGVTETVQNPYMELRGTKFNIPLDVRTPSYTDASDVAQNNLPEMWSYDFWTEYIDNLARYRYNYISLWSLHPFPSLVKVPEYPDVALNDVQRSANVWKENYHLHATGLDTPEILSNPEIIKRITIEEKIEFWKKVMRYAKDRNIDFYIITWNIFVNGTDGKYDITDDIDNEITKDYFRKSVKQLFVSYPDLAGIGLTTGENMHNSNFDKKENWAYDTYAKGLLDAAEEMPDRKFKFIHRQHMTGAKDIAEKFKPIIDNKNIEFLYSFKYAKAHVFSATKQPYHEKFVKDIAGMKTIWTLRNDSNYYFRWGAPDFVREFIENIPYDVSRGLYYGSDQWVWGREFLMKETDKPRQLEIVKHWYHWMLWGRLSYNPELSNDRFKQILKHKYPEANVDNLFLAWQEASMVYPTITGFHWGDVDFKWYPEACKSRLGPAQNKTGFHDVNRFITLPPHVKSGFQSIPDYVKMQVNNQTSHLLNPLEVAKKLGKHSDEALSIVNTIKTESNKELAVTLNDIKTMAYLGKYYEFKISGSTHLAMYRETKNKQHQEEAIKDLKIALEFWERYIAAALKQNINPLWTNRVGIVDWNQITHWVELDIEIAKELL